jgi:hypothetical protein
MLPYTELIKEHTVPKNITEKIYTIRGQKVMLDYDLAELYGYTTKAFNQQVKNNMEKFEGEEFMFQPTKEELREFVRSKNLTSRNIFTGQDGGTRYLPHAFTEQGIYMLMTVLKGSLAVKQSRALVMTFKAMKDYIIENQLTIESRQKLKLISKVAENSESILKIKNEIEKIDDRIEKISTEIDGTVKKSEISPILLDFSKITESKEFLILNGEPAKAKETFLNIFSSAKKQIFIIDNYISIKTLRLLKDAKANIEVVFFSDNIGNCLYASDLKDFKKERKDLDIKFIKTNNAVHDRFIIIDKEKIYHCGSSGKDAGKRITIIHEITDEKIQKAIKDIVTKMTKNRELILK